MAKSSKGHRLPSSSCLRSVSYPLRRHCRMIHKGGKRKSHHKSSRSGWEDARCSVCMEHPHNAVLLLCSSHDNGCRPYMCATSYRFSNCLDKFKKAYAKIENEETHPSIPNLCLKSKLAIAELSCPLCRGQVKGWTVVEAARRYLNKKKRSCMQDGCSFTGTYKKLRKHVKFTHPFVKPPQVDPVLEERWKVLQEEREREDVMSMIRSSTPGAMVLGDYVIENDGFHSDNEFLEGDGNHPERNGFGRNWLHLLWLLHVYGNSGSADFRSRLRGSSGDFRALEDEDILASLTSPALDLPIQRDMPDVGSESDHDGYVEGNDVDAEEASINTRRRRLVCRRRLVRLCRQRNRSNFRGRGLM